MEERTLGQIDLLLEERALGVQHALVVHRPLPVLDHGQIRRALRGGGCVLREHRGLLRLQIPHQAVLHLVGSLQHRVLVLHELLLEAGVLDADVVLDPSVVEDRPYQAGPERVEDAAALEEVAEVGVIGECPRAGAGLQPDLPEQGEAG
jgi:hypothetical protein